MPPKTNASRIDDLERRVAALEQQLKARGSKAGSAKQKSAELKWGSPARLLRDGKLSPWGKRPILSPDPGLEVGDDGVPRCQNGHGGERRHGDG